MSATPFAALEQQVNDAVMAHLANAVATVGGEQVAVVFDRPYIAPFGTEVDASLPECTGPASALGAVVRGDVVTIGGESFRVERAEPDGAGLVSLVLYPHAAPAPEPLP